MWLLCYQSMLKFGLWNLDWWFRIFHFLKLTPFVKGGKEGCLYLIKSNLYALYFGRGVVMYNMNNILDLCSKPSKTVRNFAGKLNSDKRQEICWYTGGKHFWEMISIFLVCLQWTYIHLISDQCVEAYP